ncbi:TatD family hydrolase [Tolumonas lignilytica]|uniref:TatD family hydrolase n=1 Tax=Tolumonas lignilytica TaxID=1283284 RepID=UPI000467A2A3|nr:TatD family hydrolase [Tolumonas lignilytica]
MLTDTHIHLDLSEYAADLPQVLARSRAVGVTRWLVPAIGSSYWSGLPLLHQQYPQLYYALGLHPWFLAQETESVLAELEAHIQQRPAGLVAIGECGLDGAVDVPMTLQITYLEKQLALASQYQLPVILHCRKAYNELLQTVKRFDLPRGGVWHAFSGSRQQAEQFIALGFMLGIGGVITYERAEKTRKALTKLPVESFLLETDGPTMPLSGRQGARNEPAYLPEILQVLADLRNVSPEELNQQIELNAEKMFRF